MILCLEYYYNDLCRTLTLPINVCKTKILFLRRSRSVREFWPISDICRKRVDLLRDICVTSYNNECDVVRISIHSTQLYNAYFNYWPGGSTQYTVSKIDDKNIKNPRLRKVLFGELKECKYINNGVSNRLVSSRYLQADDTEYYTVNQFVMNKLENPFLEGATTLHIDSKM